MIDYEFENVNPKGKRTTDCVVRALTLATGKDYVEVYKELFELSNKTGYFMNEKRLEDLFLQANGFTKFKQPRRSNGLKYKIYEIDSLADCLNNVIIIRCAHHLTVVKDYTLYDIWDCRNKTINNYYVKERK